MRRKAGFTLPELLAVLVIIAVVAAILFPVFQKIDGRPTGRVLNSAGKAIPHATLRFRDPSGRLIATITTDGQGEFRHTGLRDLSRNAIDGFALTRVLHRTGGSDVYTFTPLGTQSATFQDEAGKPVVGRIFDIGPDHHIWQWGFHAPFKQASDKNGVIQIANVPLGGRFQFESRDSGCVIKGVQTIVSPNTVKYTITVSLPPTTDTRQSHS